MPLESKFMDWLDENGEETIEDDVLKEDVSSEFLAVGLDILSSKTEFTMDDILKDVELYYSLENIKSIFSDDGKIKPSFTSYLFYHTVMHLIARRTMEPTPHYTNINDFLHDVANRVLRKNPVRERFFKTSSGILSLQEIYKRLPTANKQLNNITTLDISELGNGHMVLLRYTSKEALDHVRSIIGNGAANELLRLDCEITQLILFQEIPQYFGKDPSKLRLKYSASSCEVPNSEVPLADICTYNVEWYREILDLRNKINAGLVGTMIGFASYFLTNDLAYSVSISLTAACGFNYWLDSKQKTQIINDNYDALALMGETLEKLTAQALSLQKEISRKDARQERELATRNLSGNFLHLIRGRVLGPIQGYITFSGKLHTALTDFMSTLEAQQKQYNVKDLAVANQMVKRSLELIEPNVNESMIKNALEFSSEPDKINMLAARTFDIYSHSQNLVFLVEKYLNSTKITGNFNADTIINLLNAAHDMYAEAKRLVSSFDDILNAVDQIYGSGTLNPNDKLEAIYHLIEGGHMLHKMDAILDLDSSVPKNDFVENPGVAFLEIVENAGYHGAKRVLLHSRYDNQSNQTIISILNDGNPLNIDVITQNMMPNSTESGRQKSENLQHIFESGITTRPKGTGRGLKIVKEIVEANGGYISAYNIDDPDGYKVCFEIVF